MFEHLSTYKKIFVVGLGRSGTRICAKMIAQDTGLNFIDETEWGVYEIEKLKFLDKYRSNFVVQANSAYYMMPYFSRENTLIVWVKRDLAEIKASWDRLKELGSINTMWSKDVPPQLNLTPDERITLWDSKKSRIQNVLEINYNDLKEHPLWVDKEERKEFLWLQTMTSQFKEDEAKILK